jgi:hypothetical protein
MTHSRILFLMAACLTVAACAETPIPPLDLKEKLAGKSPEDRQEILGLACLDEGQKMSSKWKRTRHSVTLVDDPHLSETKALCLRMTVAYLSSDTKKHVALAQQCKERISTPLHSDNSTIAGHAHNMQEICEEMTGQKLHIDYAKPTD